MNNGRFAIAIHILTLLRLSKEALLSSEYIASSININPVLVRKEIAELKKTGLVNSREGKNGGCFLAKDASKIDLAVIFKSIYKDSVFSFAKNEPNPNCPVGKQINKRLNKVYADAEIALLQELKNKTLEDFCKEFE
ncbi:Rrf2 family transcriptional regulator [Pseudopedobacter beijingensis]|uniref:Rrf2 family transcriptional regulator n=1 Tax=Pseudopedobacter beijingensis TaxID=1207056 RepID=A0ABW4IFV4_9SPHI